MTPYAMITLVAVALLMAFGLGVLILGLLRAARSPGHDPYSFQNLGFFGDQGLDETESLHISDVSDPSYTEFPYLDLRSSAMFGESEHDERISGH